MSGAELLSNPNIAGEIKRLTIDRSVKVDEALELLGNQARGSIEPFLKFDMTTGAVKIDLVAARAAGVLRLVKKIRQTRQGLEVELYDSQAALIKLLEASGAFKNQQTNINVDLSTLTDEQVERIARGEDALTVIATARPSRVGIETPALASTNGEPE